MKENFAMRLKRLRNDRNYTQQELADIVGAAMKTISNYEQDICNPQAELLLRLALALDVSAEYLLLGENSMEQYTLAVKYELEQLTAFSQIQEIKNENFNATVLAHLEMTDTLVEEITQKWNASNMIRKKDGSISYCTRPYVEEIIIKYCQNRRKYIEKFKLNDGMIASN